MTHGNSATWKSKPLPGLEQEISEGVMSWGTDPKKHRSFTTSCSSSSSFCRSSAFLGHPHSPSVPIITRYVGSLTGSPPESSSSRVLQSHHILSLTTSVAMPRSQALACRKPALVCLSWQKRKTWHFSVPIFTPWDAQTLAKTKMFFWDRKLRHGPQSGI